MYKFIKNIFARNKKSTLPPITRQYHFEYVNNQNYIHYCERDSISFVKTINTPHWVLFDKY